MTNGMHSIVALVGVGGLAGIFWLFPLVQLMSTRQRNRPRVDRSLSQQPIKVALLIPAHNEEHAITRTLASIAALATPETAALAELTVLIGLDHCTDATAAKIEEFKAQHPALALKSLVAANGSGQEPGKWRMLTQLISQSRADWVFLVDAGSLLPKDLLVRLGDARARLGDSLIGFAPTYRLIPQKRNPKAALIETFYWLLEASTKVLENEVGGPIALHGACVGYRLNTLRDTLSHLESVSHTGNQTAWLNDDVVIPLTLRALHPEGQIYYDMGAVCHDLPDQTLSLEIITRRRRRMLEGNRQWIDTLWPALSTRGEHIRWLVLRRMSRLYWAAWISLLWIGTFGRFSWILSVGGVVALWIASPSARVSLHASLHALGWGALFQREKKVEWK